MKGFIVASMVNLNLVKNDHAESVKDNRIVPNWWIDTSNNIPRLMDFTVGHLELPFGFEWC